ncbi:MAG: hypothetical protein EYC70_08280 [Planctomycetota bacterium]|nr:MAG: hypothetical protein EYC70_08280 [Planctomycetota bacterium]
MSPLRLRDRHLPRNRGSRRKRRTLPSVRRRPGHGAPGGQPGGLGRQRGPGRRPGEGRGRGGRPGGG